MGGGVTNSTSGAGGGVLQTLLVEPGGGVTNSASGRGVYKPR